MAETLPVRCQEARANELDYEEFLRRLIDDELSKRKNNLINRRVKAARFPATTTLENFDFSFNTSISKENNHGAYVNSIHYQQQNILLVGPPGVGKTISLWLSVMPPFATATRFFTEAPSTWWPIWPRPIEIAPVKNWYQTCRI